VFPATQLAVFVEGCIWHGCLAHYVGPRTREEFWRAKLCGTMGRDRRQTAALEADVWRVLRSWEREVAKNIEVPVGRDRAALSDPASTPTPAPRVIEV
jgi:DNA mismatch endonuclease (patch repair protein)